MLVICGVLGLIIVGLLLYIFLGNKDENLSSDNNEIDLEVGEVNGEINESDDEIILENMGYVSCDDNTAPLNVRNSSTGNIIDSLSCYKEVSIEEEISGTDTCDNWYKISYDRDGNSYTGYACGTYIKKLEVSKTILDDVRTVIDKANDYFNVSLAGAYCGKTNDTKNVMFDDDVSGEYVKSDYKTLDELKKYVLSFLDESLIDNKLELSDVNKPKYNDNYYEIDGNLYCRNYSATGVSEIKTGNYDIEIVSNVDNKIIVNVAYEYIAETSDCALDNLKECNKSDFIYNISKITIQNGVITKIN